VIDLPAAEQSVVEPAVPLYASHPAQCTVLSRKNHGHRHTGRPTDVDTLLSNSAFVKCNYAGCL